MTDESNPVVYKYTGKAGEFFGGVPMRDLTQADYDRMDPIAKANVRAAAFYTEVKKPKQNAEPAAEVVAPPDHIPGTQD